MHGLMPYRHVPLQVEIDRANGALQTCNSAIDQYQVNLHSQLFLHTYVPCTCLRTCEQQVLIPVNELGQPSHHCIQALAILREQNQDAFFGLLAQDLIKLLPIIYTPTVGDACKQWSTLMQRPQGLYVSIKDKVLYPAAQFECPPPLPLP